MSRPSPPGIARFDSASAMAQAVGSFLHGHDVASLSRSPPLDRAMPLVNALPRRAREWVYSIGGMTEAVSSRKLHKLDFNRISEWITGLFPSRSYPGVFIGSSNGALVHLAAALAIPWLPQTFLCPVRDLLSDPDDALGSFRRGRSIAETVERIERQIAVHYMHDPNQDRLMLKMMSYFRLKYRALPPAYREFLMRHVPAGAPRAALFAIVIIVPPARHIFAITANYHSAPNRFGSAFGVFVSPRRPGLKRGDVSVCA